MKSKSLLFMIAILAIALVLFSCGSDKEPTTQNIAGTTLKQTTATTTTTTSAEPEEIAEADINEPIELRDCTVLITELKLALGYEEGTMS